MEALVGKATHYFSRLGVAVLELRADLQVGDQICIVGRITDFEQNVGSLEIRHQKINAASAGQEVALKVSDIVRPGDLVYKIQGD
jgi:hypothetical protein